MTHHESDADNLDTQCFREALHNWNVDHTGSDNTALHLPWWKLSPEEKSAVMDRAQRLKQEALEAREVPA